MNNLPVRRPPGRPRGSKDFLPMVVEFARRRRLLENTYAALEQGDKTGNYEKFTIRLRLLEVTLRAAGRPKDSSGGMDFTLHLFGFNPPLIVREALVRQGALTAGEEEEPDASEE